MLSIDETKLLLETEFNSGKKHTIRIRKEPQHPEYKTERVQVNGYNYWIPVGEEVEVPDTIYEVLIKKGLI